MPRRRSYRRSSRERLSLLGWYMLAGNTRLSFGGADDGDVESQQLLQLSPGHEPDGVDRAITFRRIRGHASFEWGGLGSPTDADSGWLSLCAFTGPYRSSTVGEGGGILNLDELANATPFATCYFEAKRVYGDGVADAGEGKPCVIPFDVKRQYKIRRGHSLFIHLVSLINTTGTGGIAASTAFRGSICARALLSDAGQG